MDIVLKPSSLAIPSTSRDLFGRDAPLFVEIGVGSGGFLADVADRHPDVNILGVDRAPQSIARSYRRLRERRLPNARLLKGDARFVIGSIVAPRGLRRVYVNYPDPWPRPKHRLRRLLRGPFLEVLSSRLDDNGEVLLTTDHREYFEYALRNAAGLFRIERPPPPEEILATKWARKGEQCYHALLAPLPNSERREISEESSDRPLELLDEMYHAVLDGKLPSLDSFEKHVFKHRHGVSVVLDAYQVPAGCGLAFLIHIEERHLSQDVIVEAREGKNGYVLTLKRFGEPLHTRAVGESVRHIAEWLEASGMRIIHRKF